MENAYSHQLQIFFNVGQARWQYDHGFPTWYAQAVGDRVRSPLCWNGGSRSFSLLYNALEETVLPYACHLLSVFKVQATANGTRCDWRYRGRLFC